MHYCIKLFTKQFPTDGVIVDYLLPYNENDFYMNEDENKEYPQLLWDWWSLGGRYSGKLKLDVTNEDGDKEWFYMKDRVNVFYRSKLMESLKKNERFFEESDYYTELGYYEGYLRVDGAKISDLILGSIDEPNCFGFIRSDGTAYARDYYTENNGFVDNNDFDEVYKEYVKTHQDEYVVIIDIHD